MALEDLTGTKYIDSLVATNPVGSTDPVSDVDGHLQGIKNTLLKTFPSVTGAVTATHTELNQCDGVVLVSEDATQTLTAKTLTSPTINTPTITSPSITSSSFSANRSTTTQSITTATWTKVKFTTEEWDTNSDFAHDAADTDAGGVLSRFTPTIAGKYSFTLSTTLVGAFTGTSWSFVVALYKNGSAVRQQYENPISTSVNVTNTFSTLIEANGTTDYFEMYVYQGDGSNRNINTADGSLITYFQAHWVET